MRHFRVPGVSVTIIWEARSCAGASGELGMGADHRSPRVPSFLLLSKLANALITLRLVKDRSLHCVWLGAPCQSATGWPPNHRRWVHSVRIAGQGVQQEAILAVVAILGNQRASAVDRCGPETRCTFFGSRQAHGAAAGSAV